MNTWWAMVSEWDIATLALVLEVLGARKLRTLGTERDDTVKAITRLEALRNSIVAWRDNETGAQEAAQ